MQPRHLVLEDAHACVITSGPLHCGLHASHTAQGNNDGQKGDKRRRGARECRTHGRLVRNMPQRHLVRPGTRRCKLARRDCVCSRGATQRAPTVPGHRRCLGTVSETSPCSETVHPRTPSTLALTSYRRCQGWKRCLRDGSWRSLARSDAEGRNTPARRSTGDKIVRSDSPAKTQ